MNKLTDLKKKIIQINENCTTDFQKYRGFSRMQGGRYELNCVVDNVTIDGKITGLIADIDEQLIEVGIGFDLKNKEICDAIAQVEKGEEVTLITELISIEFTDYKEVVFFEIKNVKRI
mgnify:CR=1 FL=1|tara:strand:+ start:119 stop:472 length:354 start_codon:yes stop_codon:yes gene_type:complete